MKNIVGNGGARVAEKFVSIKRFAKSKPVAANRSGRIGWGMLAAVAGLSFAFPAQAESPSYTFVDAGYAASKDVQGPGISASVNVVGNLFLGASYAELEFDDADIDGDGYSAGIGYAFSVGPKSDVVVSGAYAETDVLVGSGYYPYRKSVDGYLAGAGFRSRVTDKFQFGVSLDYSDFDIVNDNFGVSAEGEFFVSRYVSIVLGIADSNDGDPVGSLSIRLTRPD